MVILSRRLGPKHAIIVLPPSLPAKIGQSAPKDVNKNGRANGRQAWAGESGIESVKRILIPVTPDGEMMKRATILLACLAGVTVFTVLACGRAADPGSSADPRSQQRTQSEHDGSLAAHQEQSKQYFERALTESGTDLETRVGEYLSVLELDGQRLQAMPIDQAYTLVHDKAMRFSDARIRRQMLLALFGETEDR